MKVPLRQKARKRKLGVMIYMSVEEKKALQALVIAQDRSASEIIRELVVRAAQKVDRA